MVVLYIWIDIGHGSTDTSADRVQMPFDLGVVRSLKASGIKPPSRGSDPDQNNAQRDGQTRQFSMPGIASRSKPFSTQRIGRANLGIRFVCLCSRRSKDMC